jgi:hypothetical protein
MLAAILTARRFYRVYLCRHGANVLQVLVRVRTQGQRPVLIQPRHNRNLVTDS